MVMVFLTTLFPSQLQTTWGLLISREEHLPYVVDIRVQWHIRLRELPVVFLF